MKTLGLLRLIQDEAGFTATESILAITLLTLAAALGVFTVGGGVAEFLAGSGEDVKTPANLILLFGVNPLTN